MICFNMTPPPPQKCRIQDPVCLQRLTNSINQLVSKISTYLINQQLIGFSLHLVPIKEFEIKMKGLCIMRPLQPPILLLSFSPNLFETALVGFNYPVHKLYSINIDRSCLNYVLCDLRLRLHRLKELAKIGKKDWAKP
jgi:hypothetical protein